MRFDDRRQASLTAFSDGAPPADDGAIADGPAPERPSPDERFTVVVTDSAVRDNAAAAAVVEDRGATLRFPSEDAAAAFATDLSEAGDAAVPVRLQAVAPQDDTDADAYLVASPARHRRSPVDPDAEPWVFDTGANQYGALGQALLATPGRNPPALTYYVREHLDLPDEEALRVELRDRQVATTRTADGPRTWIPDVVARARRERTGAVLGEYWCEIKTGAASLRRDQLAAMTAKAREPGVTVLTARVDVADLPDRYAVRFEDVLDREADG